MYLIYISFPYPVLLVEFTRNLFRISVVWNTKKIKTLFAIKDKIVHRANVIYKGTSENNPVESYIGETKQIAEERWKQHEDPAHDSAPSKYLQENPNDHFTWEVLSTSSSNLLKRRIHEALFICKQKPTLNRQVDHKNLFLFRNGVT